MLSNIRICFEMLSTQITLQSHLMWFIRVEKTVYPFLFNTTDNFNLDTEQLIILKCFLMFNFVLNTFHTEYIAIQVYVIYNVEKTVYAFLVVITTNLTNVLQPKNLWVPFSNAFTNSLTHEILKFSFWNDFHTFYIANSWKSWTDGEGFETCHRYKVPCRHGCK